MTFRDWTTINPSIRGHRWREADEPTARELSYHILPIVCPQCLYREHNRYTTIFKPVDDMHSKIITFQDNKILTGKVLSCSHMPESLRTGIEGFASGPVVKTLSCRATGHLSVVFSTWSRKIPRAVEQRSPCATTTEPRGCGYWSTCAPGPVLPNKREATTRRSPHEASRE